MGPPRTAGVVIRTLNESALVGTCIETLRRQRGDVELDLLVVDSGSTDGTLEIAESHGVRVHHLPPGDFDYSRAINVGMEHVRGDVVFLLSAHAIPVDDDWVERMTAPFADPQIAGVAGRQLPWEGAPWREVQRLARQFPAESRVYGRDDLDSILFSNAASCVRRSAWREQPFTLPAAEDMEWAGRVVSAGWRVGYLADAPVYHSHDESPRAQARRLIDINRVEEARRSPLRTLREAARLLYRDGRAILRLPARPRRKLAHLAELVQMVGYYVADFSRSGTTAQRRRQDG